MGRFQIGVLLVGLQVASSAQTESLRERLVAMQSQWNCTELLYETPCEGDEAVSELVRLLRDPREDVRQRAAALLARKDDGRSRANKEYLFVTPGDTLVWVRAARVLGGYGSTLVKQVDSDDPQVRFEAAYSVADGSPESLPVLLDLLDHADPTVRALAAEGIAWAIWTCPMRRDTPATERHHTRKMDLGACVILAEGLDEIARALMDEDARVRRFAALTARKLGERAEPLREALDLAASDDDPSVRCLSAASLAHLDKGDWPGLDDLGALERSPRPLRGLSRTELEDALHDSPEWKLEQDAGLPDSPDRRFEAAHELARHHLPDLLAAVQAEPSGGPAHQLLDAMLAAKEEHVHLVLFSARRHNEEAIQAAIDLGLVVLPGLEYEVLRSGRFPYGWPMFDELVQVIRGLGDPSLPLAIEWQTSQGRIARYWAADTLAAFGPKAVAAAPFVVSAWRNGDRGFGVPGSDPFWECDPTDALPWDGPLEGDPNAVWAAMGEKAIPVLTRCLADSHARVRRRACKVLAGLCETDWDIDLNLVAALLDDEDPTVRVAAARAVLALGGKLDPAAGRAQEIIRLGED